MGFCVQLREYSTFVSLVSLFIESKTDLSLYNYQVFFSLILRSLPSGVGDATGLSAFAAK